MVSEICKAKVPADCPFHGNVMKMYEAQARGDVIAYFEARTIVEAKKKTWNEDDLNTAIAGSLSTAKAEQPKVAAKKAEERIIPDEAPVVESGAPASEADEGFAVKSDDSRVQQGIVFDRVEHEGTVFHRSRDGVYPDWPYQIRIQANRELDAEDVKKMASLMGYKYRTTVAGESLGWPERDTPFSFIVYADTTKTSRDDIGPALDDFESQLPTMVQEGSPLRKRTQDQAIEGFHEPDLEFSIYYDSVSED